MTRISDVISAARLSRYSAWTATITVFLFIVTGYGMTKWIINPDFSRYMHEKVLPIPLFLSLLLHAGICARNALRRWQIFKSGLTADLYVMAVSIILLAVCLWMFLR